MENILHHKFIEIISLTQPPAPHDHSHNEQAYQSFIHALPLASDRCSSYIAVYRALNQLDISFRFWQQNQIGKKNSDIRTLVRKAHQFVKSEQQLLEKRINNPELFANCNRSERPSPLRWSKTKTELAELLVALDLDGAIFHSNGSKAEFTEVVRSVRRLFNVDLGEPADIRRSIIRRKIKLTAYLDKLKATIKNHCFSI